MVAFDTNVLVRVVVGDDPVQTKKAEHAFVRHTRGDGVFVSLLVLAEIAWVLADGYDWGRALIHDRLMRLVRTRGIVVEDLSLVTDALDGYRDGKADLADYLILEKAKAAGATALLTFDRMLAREGKVNLL